MTTTPRALVREALGDRPADAARRAGHDGDLARELSLTHPSASSLHAAVPAWRPVSHARPHHGPDAGDDVGDLRHGRLLEGEVERDHRVLAGDPDDRRPQLVEGLLGDHRRDVAGDAAALDGLLGDHQPAGPADRLEHARRCPSGRASAGRCTSTEIPSRRQLLGRLQALDDHVRPGHERHVRAGPLDLGLAERDHVVLVLGDLAVGHVQQLVLDEDDRVVVADRRLEQALGVRAAWTA